MSPEMDISQENQESMEAWFLHVLSPDQKLYQNGLIPMLKPQFVSCDYANKKLTLAYDVQEWEMNPQNAMHGGITVAAIDTAFGILCHYFAKRKMVTTVTLSTTYLKPIWLHDRIYVTATVTSIGKNLISMVAEVHTERDNLLVTTANTTFMVLKHTSPY
jgi:uncharacterized protein (TIGR00369 family)